MQKTHGRAEDYNAINVSDFYKAGVFTHGYIGGWQWGNGKSSISINTSEKQLTLSYGSNGKSFNYPIQIDSTPCNYGGVRYWFKCPRCNGRVGKLYIDGNLLFECRKCKKLNYATQQDNKLDSTRLVMYRIREKLKWQYDSAWMQPWHRIKPKGMHYSTFDKLVARHDDLEAKTNRYCMASFKSFMDKHGFDY